MIAGGEGRDGAFKEIAGDEIAGEVAAVGSDVTLNHGLLCLSAVAQPSGNPSVNASKIQIRSNRIVLALLT